MDSIVIGKIENQSDCRLLIPSLAVKEGWKCGNINCSAYGQWLYV